MWPKEELISGSKETFFVKIIYVAVFLFSALGTFFATEQFSVWLKLQSDVLSLLPIQLILIMFPMYLLTIVEGKVLWRLAKEDGFNSLYPFTVGVCVGYLLHF